MAYVNKEKKAKIATALKLVIPKTWKWSLAVRNYSTIVLTVASADVDLIDAWYSMPDNKRQQDGHGKPANLQVNRYWLPTSWPAELVPLLARICAALDTDNHDRSDSMTDYFDVGHYVDFNIGRWNKPFTVKGN
jgi:hypothetical protein